jgi:hypothetical protein
LHRVRPRSTRTIDCFQKTVTLLLAAFVAFYYIFSSNNNKASVALHDETNASFEIQDLPGRGKGLVATKDIQQGELILREAPLLLLPPESKFCLSSSFDGIAH